jgi:hypothetical protein
MGVCGKQLWFEIQIQWGWQLLDCLNYSQGFFSPQPASLFSSLLDIH